MSTTNMARKSNKKRKEELTHTESFPMKMNVDGFDDRGSVVVGEQNVSVVVPLEGQHVMVIMKKDHFFHQLVLANRKVNSHKT